MYAFCRLDKSLLLCEFQVWIGFGREEMWSLISIGRVLAFGTCEGVIGGFFLSLVLL